MEDKRTQTGYMRALCPPTGRSKGFLFTMNYRHAYHAGNFADVLKHTFLIAALETLASKDKSFFILDTHAGTGFYDLEGTESDKTGEWKDGIGRLFSTPAPLPPLLTRYHALIQNSNPDGRLRFYPGSPELIRRLLRDQDRLAARELHPQDAEHLAGNIGPDRRVSIEVADGYAALKTLLPPPERRGLVLIDPPFERTDEFVVILKAIAQGLKRWATGAYMIWFPIKDRKDTQTFLNQLTITTTIVAPRAKLWTVDLFVDPETDPARLSGCGLAFINPPWGVLKAAEDILPFLGNLLAQGSTPLWETSWRIPLGGKVV